jgi:uncharacterized protein DUF3891
MIRRPDPASNSWLLISQAEHARLSGEMAAAWNAPACGDIEPRDALLYAIAHHDDGWPEWERSPGIDADGRPVNFDEMSPVEATEIWRRSIDYCAHFDPVAGCVVAGHFTALLERFNSWRRAPDPVRSAAEAFLADCQRQMDRWLADWPGRPATAQVSADHAVSVLQLFDALSLWLCCQARSEAAKFIFPGAGRFEFAPTGENEFVVSPWPLKTAELLLQVPASHIPARPYTDREDLRRAIDTTVTIVWRLRPPGAGQS